MCFSTSASFTAAGVISFVGVLSLLKARTPKIWMLAITPIFFGIQQAFEGIVWLTATENSLGFLHKFGIYGFISLATLFWPVWLPLSLYRLETNPTSKKLLKITLGLGIFFALFSLLTTILYGRTAEIIDHHIVYPFLTSPFHSDKWLLIEQIELVMTVIYALATIGSLFISSIKRIWIIGVIVALGFIVSQISYSLAFGSVWCFFAALASVFVYFIVDKSVR